MSMATHREGIFFVVLPACSMVGESHISVAIKYKQQVRAFLETVYEMTNKCCQTFKAFSFSSLYLVFSSKGG